MSTQPVFNINYHSFREEAVFGSRRMKYMLPPPQKLISQLYEYWQTEYGIDLWLQRTGKRPPYEKFISSHILYERGFKVCFISKVIGVPRTSTYYMLKKHYDYIQTEFDYQIFMAKILNYIIKNEYGDMFDIKIK